MALVTLISVVAALVMLVLLAVTANIALWRITTRLNIMATKADLDAALAALPAAIETAIETALAPVIAAIVAKAGSVDFQPEIDQLNAVAGAVSAKVTTDLTPA